MHAPEHFGQFAARALDGLLDECLADAECARAFPGIRQEARQVFDRLRQGPVTAFVAHPSFSDRSRESSDRSRESSDRSRETSDRSRETSDRSRDSQRGAEVTLTRDHVAEAIRYMTYSSARRIARAAVSARGVQRQLLADRRLPDSLAGRGHVRRAVPVDHLRRGRAARRTRRGRAGRPDVSRRLPCPPAARRLCGVAARDAVRGEHLSP